MQNAESRVMTAPFSALAIEFHKIFHKTSGKPFRCAKTKEGRPQAA
jgi:hypothetical protein